MFEDETQELSFGYIMCWMPNRYSVEMSSGQLNFKGDVQAGAINTGVTRWYLKS